MNDLKAIEAYTCYKGLGQIGLIKAEGDHFVRLAPKALGPWEAPSVLAKAYK